MNLVNSNNGGFKTMTPILQDGQMKLIDLGPILMYVADKFPHKNLSPPLCTKERALFMTCLVFSDERDLLQY